MFPNDEGLSLPSGVVTGCCTIPSVSHTSATPDIAMQTLVSGLQDMFRHQELTTQEDRQDHRRFEAEMKAFLESAPIVTASSQIFPALSSTRTHHRLDSTTLLLLGHPCLTVSLRANALINNVGH
jgi:hypothetical protein